MRGNRILLANLGCTFGESSLSKLGGRWSTSKRRHVDIVELNSVLLGGARDAKVSRTSSAQRQGDSHVLR